MRFELPEFGLRKWPKFPPFRPAPSQEDYSEILGDDHALYFIDGRFGKLKDIEELKEAINIARAESEGLSDGIQIYQVITENDDEEIEVWEYKHQVTVTTALERLKKVELPYKICHSCGIRAFVWNAYKPIDACSTCVNGHSNSHVQCIACSRCE